MSRNPYLAQRYGLALQQIGNHGTRAQEESDTEYDASIGFMRFPHSTYMRCTVFKPSVSPSRVPNAVASDLSSRQTPPNNVTGRSGRRYPYGGYQVSDGFTPSASRSSSTSGALPPLLPTDSKSSSARHNTIGLAVLTDQLRRRNDVRSSGGSESDGGSSSSDSNEGTDHGIARDAHAKATTLTNKNSGKDDFRASVMRQNDANKDRLDGLAIGNGARHAGLRGSALVDTHDAAPLLSSSTSDSVTVHQHVDTEDKGMSPQGSAVAATTMAASNGDETTKSTVNRKRNSDNNGKTCARLAAPWAPEVTAPATALSPHSPGDALDFVSPLSGLVETTFPRVAPPPPLVIVDGMHDKTPLAAAQTGKAARVPDRADSEPLWRTPHPKARAEESNVAHYALLTCVANPAALVARRRQRRRRPDTTPLTERGGLPEACRVSSSQGGRQGSGLAEGAVHASTELPNEGPATPSGAPHTPPRLTLAEHTLDTRDDLLHGAGAARKTVSSCRSPGHAIPMAVFDAVMERLTDFLRAGRDDAPRQHYSKPHNDTAAAVTESCCGEGKNGGENRAGETHIASDGSHGSKAVHSAVDEEAAVTSSRATSADADHSKSLSQPSRRGAVVPPPRVLVGRPLPSRPHRPPMATSPRYRQGDDGDGVRGVTPTVRSRLDSEVVTSTSELAHVDVGHAAAPRRSVSQRRLPSYAQPTESWLSKGVEQEEMTAVRLSHSVLGDVEVAVGRPVVAAGGDSRPTAHRPRL